MSKSLPKTETSLLQKHLDRARDLGVELDEYAEAYNWQDPSIVEI